MTDTHEEILLAENPAFEAGRPMSYESVLCRLAGWWTQEPNESTLMPDEIVLLRLRTVA